MFQLLIHNRVFIIPDVTDNVSNIGRSENRRDAKNIECETIIYFF